MNFLQKSILIPPIKLPRKRQASFPGQALSFKAIPHKLTTRIQPETYRRKKAVFRRNTLCISRKNNAFSAIKIGCSPMAHLCGVALSHISLVYQFSHEKAMKKWLRNPSADRMVIRRSRPEFPIFTAYFHRLLPKERKRPINSLQRGKDASKNPHSML